ncbi:MAG: Rieske (2Fe-2S) protein [Acidimicrobiales bacterium]
MPDVALCRVSDLQEGRGWPVRVGEQRLAVFLVDGELRVIDNVCPHQDSPLDGAAVDGRVLVCPWHGWTFDLDSGALLTAFGDLPGLVRHDAWLDGGVVMARLPEPGRGMGD